MVTTKSLLSIVGGAKINPARESLARGRLFKGKEKEKLLQAHIRSCRGYLDAEEVGGLLGETPHTSMPMTGLYLGFRGQKLAVDIVAWGSESATVRSGDSMTITETLDSKTPAGVMILSFITPNIRIRGLQAHYVRLSLQGVVEVEGDGWAWSATTRLSKFVASTFRQYLWHAELCPKLTKRLAGRCCVNFA